MSKENWPHVAHLKIRLRAKVLNKIRCNPSLVAVGFVVKVDHVALGEQLCGISAVIPDGVDMWKRFHPELAVEAASKRVEDLVFFLCTMPYIPLMHVPNSRVRCFQTVTPWRAWMIGYMRTLCCNHFRE